MPYSPEYKQGLRYLIGDFRTLWNLSMLNHKDHPGAPKGNYVFAHLCGVLWNILDGGFLKNSLPLLDGLDSRYSDYPNLKYFLLDAGAVYKDGTTEIRNHGNLTAVRVGISGPAKTVQYALDGDPESLSRNRITNHLTLDPDLLDVRVHPDVLFIDLLAIMPRDLRQEVA